MDPGGTLPSSGLAGMLLPALPVGPLCLCGTLSQSDSDPAGPDGPYVTSGPVIKTGTLFPSASESAILVDPGGMFPSSDLARTRGPAPPAGSAVLMGPVGPAMSLGVLPLSESAEPVMPSRIQYSSVVELLGPLDPVVTLLPGEDGPELCPIGVTIGLLPGAAVPLPAMRDPMIALSPVEGLERALLCTVVGLVRTLLGPLPWLLWWKWVPCRWAMVLRWIVQSGAQPGMVVASVRWWMTGRFAVVMVGVIQHFGRDFVHFLRLGMICNR